MAYGTDVTVFVEDIQGDLGGQPPPGSVWWLSPDVDIVGHPGEAVQGPNDVRIRVHAHDEPILEGNIVAEVYVGKPSLVMSPTTGTKRIDPGGIVFRPTYIPGPEPVASEAGGTATFQWTPSAVAADVDGPGHRCLIVRAFPADVVPPTTPFDVYNEPHEAQHNIEVLTTAAPAAPMSEGGAGTSKDPRLRDDDTGMWWERFTTMARTEKGESFVVWAFDPAPGKQLVAALRGALPRGKRFAGFSKEPPATVALEAQSGGDELDPAKLLANKKFAKRAGLGGKGVFCREHLLAATTVAVKPDELSQVVLRFDHSNLPKGSAVVLHGAQFDARGTPEGGMTMVALAP